MIFKVRSILQLRNFWLIHREENIIDTLIHCVLQLMTLIFLFVYYLKEISVRYHFFTLKKTESKFLTKFAVKKLRLRIATHSVYLRGRREVLRELPGNDARTQVNFNGSDIPTMRKRACIFISQDIPPMWLHCLTTIGNGKSKRTIVFTQLLLQ